MFKLEFKARQQLEAAARAAGKRLGSGSSKADLQVGLEGARSKGRLSVWAEGDGGGAAALASLCGDRSASPPIGHCSTAQGRPTAPPFAGGHPL